MQDKQFASLPLSKEVLNNTPQEVIELLSLRQTCRLQEKPTYPYLVAAFASYLSGSKPVAFSSDVRESCRSVNPAAYSLLSLLTPPCSTPAALRRVAFLRLFFLQKTSSVSLLGGHPGNIGSRFFRHEQGKPFFMPIMEFLDFTEIGIADGDPHERRIIIAELDTAVMRNQCLGLFQVKPYAVRQKSLFLLLGVFGLFRHGLPRDIRPLNKGNDFFPVLFQAQPCCDPQIRRNQGFFKRLVSADQFAQIAAKGVLICCRELQDRVEVFAVLLINLKFLKAEIAEPDRAIMRIKPDHNRSRGETSCQGA